MKHNWTKSDDLKILYIFKFGFQNLKIDKSELAKSIGVSVGSVSYRIGNFKAIEGLGKANHIAKLSQKVYKECSTLNEVDLRSLAFQ